MVRRRPTPGGEQQQTHEMFTATKDEEEAPGIGQHTGASSSLEVLGGAGHEDRAFPVAHDHGAAIQQLAGTSPTLHKLLHIQEDRLDLSFVEKVTVPPEHLFALCNLLTPGSAVFRDDRSVVDFDVLNKSERRVVGLYGCKETLLDALRSLRVLDAATESQLKHDKLAPGIYGVLCEKILYVLYWHPGSRMEPPSRKGVSCNFIRYIVDLCDSVYVCLDQKILQAFLAPSASRTAAKSKRVERKKIFSVKDSEDNIQLQPGFRIFPPAMKPDDALTMLVAGNSSQELDLRPRLSAGLLRCGVLTPTVCPPRKVYRQDEISVKLGKLQASIMEWSESHNVMIDMQLPDQDLRCLLHCAELPGSLEYRALVESSEKRRAQVKDAFYKGPEALKRAEEKIVCVLNKALSICLQHKYSWEVTALGGAECFQILQENADRSLRLGEQAMIQLERELCMIWMDYPDGVEGAEQLSLLFIGSEISFQSIHEWYVIESLTQSDSRVTGPILYGQQFLAISKRSKSKHRFTLLPENGSSSGGVMGPVIVTSQSLRLLSDDSTYTLKCRVSPSSNGMMEWIQSYVQVNTLPQDLRRKADILSCIVRSGNKADTEETLRKLKEVSRSTAPARDFDTAFPDQRIEQLVRQNGLGGCEVRTGDGSHEAEVRIACRAVYEDAVKKFEAHIHTSLVKKILLPMLEGKKKGQQGNSQSLELELEKLESDFLQQLRGQVVQRDHGRCNLQITRCYPLQSPLSRVVGFFNLGGLFNREDEIRIQYRLEETEDERVSWQMTELTPLKKDLEKSARDKNHVIVPRFSDQYKLIDLDPSSQRLMKVVTVKTGETLIFVENIEDRVCSLYISPKIGGQHTGAGYPNRAFHRGFDLVAFDEHSSFLALYDRNYKKISIHKFDESFRHLDFYSDAQLEEYAGIRDLTDMIFIPGKRELVLIDNGNTVRVLELSHDSMVKSSNITLPAAATHACVTTNGACLLVFSKALSCLQDSQPPTETALLSDADPPAEAAALPCSSTATEEAVGTTPPTDASTTLEAAIPNGQQSDGSNSHQVLVQDGPVEMHVYLLNDRLSFLKTVQLDYLAADMTSIETTVTSFDSQMHLIVLERARPANGINSHVLEITCASQLFQLRPVKGKQIVGEHLPETEQTETASICPELDYIPLVFEKYSTSPPLLHLKRELFVHFLLGGRSKATHGDLKDRCIDYVHNALAKMKAETWKDFTNLSIHLRSDILEKYLGPDALLLGTCISSRNVAALGDWIRRLFCLVPIQLARAENNSLRPLRDGMQIPPSMTYGNAVSLSQIIRFGFYDAVLSHWTGSVKVVSSMGKQSSGKSYLLNHLSGSLLDVAGGRCTDGVWMTMRTTETCLYVILDFEGLGSFERSETEDMLLSILNAAVSNITIFNKKDFHLDKETEAVFARFQTGISLVKEDSRLFKGIFYMAIKDVAQTDVEDLKTEFWGKIEHMCGMSNEENFLTKMYGSDCMVAALPPFQSKAYQESICELAETVTDDTPAVFQNGSTFATDLKLLIAQFSAKDWSPMDTKRIALRIDNLERHLKTAISLGSLDRQVDNAFINFETREVVADTPVQLDEHVFTLSDTGLELSPHQESQVVGSILQSLREKFEAVVKRTGCKDEIWHAAFGRFLSAVAGRRHERVSQWLKCNTDEFQIDGDIQKLHMKSEAMLGDMRQSLSLCNSKCQNCFLLCVFEKLHPSGSEHTCMGSHSCSQTCEHCKEEGDASTECGDLSGHEGPHDCKLRNHTCGDVCSKSAISSNCSKQCNLKPNHEGDHLCNTSQHKCGHKCSLESCTNLCTIDLDKDHDRHICHEQLCPMDCGMTGCNKRCESKDHFHALVTSNHLCGFEHTCMAECKARGICQIVTDMVKREKTFHGKRSQFEYEHLSEQNGIKKNCCKPIPPGQQNHEGEHTHTMKDGAVHFCDVKCMACGYFCNLPIDHPGLHDTTHGNMRDLYFAAESEEIDIQDRQYVWGESGIAEMCMMHCRAQGRGHIHLVECNPKLARNLADVAGSTSSSTHQRESPLSLSRERGFPCLIKLLDGARHQTRRYGPKFNVPKDELTHVAYWQYLRFKDPCPDEQFGLCGHFCKSEEHVSSNASRERSYCTEKIWHSPVTKGDRLSAGARSGHVTDDGHFLTCNHHHSDLSHIVFVIDRSGSMDNSDFQPSLSKFTTRHNNRLGCVYESLLRFIRRRPAHGDKDFVSIILFNHEATLEVDRLTLYESVVDQLLPHGPAGWTSYSGALGLVANHLQIVTPSGNTRPARDRPPVVILLGDGESSGRADDEKCVKLVNEMKVVNSKLVLHTIFCGKELGGIDLMRKLAAAGGGTFSVNIDEVELTKTFEDLARTLRPQVNSTVISSRKRS